MRGRHMAFAILALTQMNQSASAARFEGQFDLACDGKISVSGNPWMPRFSVDIGRGLFCSRTDKGECVQNPPKEIAQITPDSLVLLDFPASEKLYRTTGSVSSATDEMKVEQYKPEGVVLFSRAACRREAFTPFPLIRAP